MAIELVDLIDDNLLNDCKIHLASWNQEEHPLDVFVRSRKEWASWNEYRGKKNVFNRDYIFTLIDFYHEPKIWLFGGIFRVKSRYSDRYDVELCHEFHQFIGRLKIRYERSGRARVINVDGAYERMSVYELLPSIYKGESFCGYENINHSFSALELIYKRSRADWKAALENVKGIYLITDISNGKRYIGSAYGGAGIWARWNGYIETGHGWTDELTKRIEIRGITYARKYFRFSLLEHYPMKTNDQIILSREKYWKDILLSRGKYGYNGN